MSLWGDDLTHYSRWGCLAHPSGGHWRMLYGLRHKMIIHLWDHIWNMACMAEYVKIPRVCTVLYIELCKFRSQDDQLRMYHVFSRGRVRQWLSEIRPGTHYIVSVNYIPSDSRLGKCKQTSTSAIPPETKLDRGQFARHNGVWVACNNIFFFRLGRVLRNWLLIICSILCLTIRCSVERPRRVIIMYSRTYIVLRDCYDPPGRALSFQISEPLLRGNLGKGRLEQAYHLVQKHNIRNGEGKLRTTYSRWSLGACFSSFLLFAFLTKGRVCSQHSSCQGKWCVVDVNYVATANHKRYILSPTFFTVADWLLTGNL